MKLHLDDTSIKVLVGLIIALIIFTGVMPMYGREVKKHDYENDFVEHDIPDLEDEEYDPEEPGDWKDVITSFFTLIINTVKQITSGFQIAVGAMSGAHILIKVLILSIIPLLVLIVAVRALEITLL